MAKVLRDSHNGDNEDILPAPHRTTWPYSEKDCILHVKKCNKSVTISKSSFSIVYLS